MKVWNTQTLELEYELQGHLLPIWAIEECDTEKGTIATASSDFSIITWNLAKKKKSKTMTGHSKPVWCLVINIISINNIDKSLNRNSWTITCLPVDQKSN